MPVQAQETTIKKNTIWETAKAFRVVKSKIVNILKKKEYFGQTSNTERMEAYKRQIKDMKTELFPWWTPQYLTKPSWKPLLTLKNRKSRLEFNRKLCRKHLHSSENKFFVPMKSSWNGNDKKSWLKQRNSSCLTMFNRSSVRYGRGSVIACMAASGVGSLVFIDDVTVNRSMNAEVRRAFCADSISYCKNRSGTN